MAALPAVALDEECLLGTTAQAENCGCLRVSKQADSVIREN